MKKYKELFVKCNSQSESLEGLVKIGDVCKTGKFSYSEELEKMYLPNDRLNHILVKISGFPQAVIFLYADDSGIKVLNIVPYNKSCDHIEKDIYNKIIDIFEKDIIKPLFPDNEIIVTKETVSMKDIIPNSFKYLYLWTQSSNTSYSPFCHPQDLGKWFDFICQLHISKEELSSGDLEQWLIEDIQWNEDIVTETIIRFETERDLLTYYDNCNSHV